MVDKKIFLLLFCFFYVFTSINHIKAEENSEKKAVYIIDIKKEIGKTTELYLNNGIEEAKSLQADAILLHMNTYGGMLEAADSMRTAILYSPIPVYVYIDNNAASAGALISIACKKIYMRKGASIGAASVVNQTGEILPDKYQSYMRSLMRSTAEAHGKDTIIQNNDTTYQWIRDPLIAEAMVDERTIVPLLSDSGKVLTMTAEEAMQWNYCDGIAESIEEIITEHIGFNNYIIKKYEPSLFDKIKGFLMNPIFQSLLILIIIGGIYFELQTPGMGFPSIAAIIAAIFYFAPLYIDGLAQNWEILLFIIGIILVILEVFVIPGFGISGITGIICIIVGLTMSLLDNFYFNFEGISSAESGQAALTVLFGITCGFFLMLWLSSRIGDKGLFHRISLNKDLEDSISSLSLNEIVGKEGIAATVLRPSGKVDINGEYYDGVSESGFIEKGSTVKVVRFENAQVYVVSID